MNHFSKHKLVRISKSLLLASMASVRNIASRYLEALEDSAQPRQPLSTLKFNSKSNLNVKKLDSPDLEDLARQMNIETPARSVLLRNSFETPSATVSSFKTTPKSRSGSKTSKDVSSLSQPATFKPGSKTSKGYEYLCRIQAIKNWLEVVLQEKIAQDPVTLISYIQNGIYLAKLANVFLPVRKNVYANDRKLEFRHTENINRFFKLLQHLNIPDLFRFELTDLYDAKDVPKVWFCLHAMSYIIHQMDVSYPAIENLVGKLEFSESEIKTANRALVGHSLPNFSSADNGSSTDGHNSYINRTLTMQTPSKLPIRPKIPPSTMDDPNPFREKSPTILLLLNYELNSVRKPDLSAAIHKTPESSPTKSAGVTLSPVQLLSLDRLSPLEVSSPVHMSPVGQVSSLYGRSPVNYGSSPVLYKPASVTYTHTTELDSHVVNVIKLQALSKGAIFRYKMFVDKIILRSYDSELTELFSVIRGNLTRGRTVHRHRDDLRYYEQDIKALQSIARSKLLRRFLGYGFTADSENSVRDVQNIIRGSMARQRVRNVKSVLKNNESKLILLQCIIRGKGIHRRVSTVTSNRSQVERSLIELQSMGRRILYNRRSNSSIVSRLEEQDMVPLQSLIRGAKARNQVRFYLRGLGRERNSMKELQSIGRGAILRTRLCNNVLITLLGEDIKMNELFAKVRGNSVRRQVEYKKAVLDYVAESEIIPLQTIFRGILLRFRQDVDMEDIYEDVNSIITLQAKIRANKIVMERKQLDAHYTTNLDKVIKAQSILRSKYTQNAYKALINMKNPPVGVVRKFAYLLSNSGQDYLEEMELSKLKDLILEKSKNNEELELLIENLDIKLSLLDKNKISIEDFMKQNNKFKAYKPIQPKTMNVKNLDKLNVSSRKRIELYQSMFYFLQTKPTYWLRLYKEHPSCDRDEYIKNLQYQILLVYPILKGSVNSHSREEFFFLKFICALMENDMRRSKNIADITKVKSALWIDYIVDFNNHVYQRMHLKQIFGKIVSRIIDEDELTFESDPSIIYNHIREKENRIHGTSSKKMIVTPQEAIQDEEVSASFVRNLIALREAATDSLEIIQSSVSEIPIHVRILAHQAYQLSLVNFPDHSEQQHLAVAGVIIIKHYFNNILQFPENFGYSTKDPYAIAVGSPSTLSENLKHLSRVLLQIFSMKPFSDNFMKPLNDYVTSCAETTRDIIKDVIKVKLLEIEYEMNDYDDIVAHSKPQLTMKVSDMIAVEKMITRNLDVVAPSLDDQLYTIASELNEVVNSADDFVTLTEMGSLTLTLSPKTQEDTVADSKVRTLLTQAKRCLLYIIRVQDGDDLLELFIHGIKPIHEDKFRKIIEIENDGSNGNEINPYRKSFLGDLTKMSYIDLKKLALKVILQLESLEIVSRKNSFQELLNLIVVDIKTKDSQRVSRKSQLKVANQTVNKLLEKEKFLTRQLKDYELHIEKVLGELQLKPKEKKIFNIIPVFSKQYFYHRQLRKNNRLPKFGSYKYSAKRLMDQDIILDFGGDLSGKSASSSKLDFMFSCHKLGTFVIEAATGSVTIPGACGSITLDQLLDQQYEKKKKWEMFNRMVTFDTENLSALIFRKFYDIKKD